MVEQILRISDGLIKNLASEIKKHPNYVALDDDLLTAGGVIQTAILVIGRMADDLEAKTRRKTNLKRNLVSVAEFAETGPFTEGQLRWWIFNAKKLGLETALVKVQRRLYIDVDKFGEWIDSNVKGEISE